MSVYLSPFGLFRQTPIASGCSLRSAQSYNIIYCTTHVIVCLFVTLLLSTYSVPAMAVHEVNIQLSMKIFLTAFYFYSFMIHSFYDCNLRAYLMSSDFGLVAENAEDFYKQGRPLFMQYEYSEEDFYKSLPEDLYQYEKLLVEETYKNGYHFATTDISIEEKNIYYVYSREFDQVCKSQFHISGVSITSYLLTKTGF